MADRRAQVARRANQGRAGVHSNVSRCDAHSTELVPRGFFFLLLLLLLLLGCFLLTHCPLVATAFRIKDRMLVGVKFVDDKQLAVSCFDSYKLVMFSKV